MELRQLRHFVTVAEEGNISRAAQRIFLTQPALSRQIKALEEEIGQCLFERQAHSIRLTAAGELLLREARELLRRAEQVVEKIRSVGRGVRLRVGYAPSLAAGMLSSAVECFAQTHSDARVELFDLSSGEILRGLEDRSLDVALTVRTDGKTPGLKWTALMRGAWKLAVNSKHRLAGQKRIAPADLSREKFLIFYQRDYPEYWDIVSGWFREHKLRLRIAGEYDGANSLMAAVESGLGVALVSARGERFHRSRIRLKTLATPPKPLCIAAGYRADREEDKVLGVFVEELRKAAEAVY